MNLQKTLFVSAWALAYAGVSYAAVSPEEAKKLGTTLTYFGAEKSGNDAGTIPAYTGGVTTPPAGFKKGDLLRPDPFSNEKPLFSIDAKNMEKYADKLTDGAKALIKKYPSYRVDVYPTHRSVAYPNSVKDNTLKCATTAKTKDAGVSFEGCHGGVPFPIPQDGFEVMWNHLTAHRGDSYRADYQSLFVDTSGKLVTTGGGAYFAEYPYWHNTTQNTGGDQQYFRVKVFYSVPTRRAGEIILSIDHPDVLGIGRKVWSYLPGQRRVRLAPTVAHDTPNPSTGGSSTYDDAYVFDGSMERFKFKLLGKKEMYVPYNDYKLTYWSKAADVMKPNHINPDFVRWELHRVWVVEATLAEGKRHIYSKRVFYVDEDSWSALASDEYDMRGQFYRTSFSYPAPSYDVPAAMVLTHGSYDLISGIYVLNIYFAEGRGTGIGGGGVPGLQYLSPTPDKEWTPDFVAGSGTR